MLPNVKCYKSQPKRGWVIPNYADRVVQDALVDTVLLNVAILRLSQVHCVFIRDGGNEMKH